MRISVQQGDPDYDLRHAFAAVFLDDVPVKNCINADDEAGEVVVAKTDGKGRHVLEDGKPVLETRRGMVRIVTTFRKDVAVVLEAKGEAETAEAPSGGTADVQRLVRLLEAERKRQGKTQADVSAHLRQTRQAVSNWERHISYPPAEILFSWAAFLNVRIHFTASAEATP